MMDGMVLPGAGEAPADDELTAEDRQAALAALAALPHAEYAACRTATAIRLGTTRGDLDSAVKAARARRRAEAEAAARAAPEPGPGEVRWPAGILARPDGLYADAGDDAPRLWLAAPFEVMGEARNAAGEGWGLFLRWRDRDGRPHTWTMPARLLMAEPGALEAAFVERGLRVSADPRARLRLRMALAEVKAGGRVRLAHRAGWQEPPDTAFLLPDGEVIGTSAEAVVLENPPEDAARLCAAAGTLDGWQREVAAPAVGNPLAAFCLSAAFAAPLLQVVQAAGGGVHIHGGSKRGKTLAVQMGLSAWGLPYKGAALRDWNSSANGFEATAEEAGDMLLALDELHQANPADAARTVYAMADGAGKKRLDRNARGRRRRTWRAFLLSTGEHDLGTAVAKAGQSLPAGADVRLPSVAVGDALATWPALHGRDGLQLPSEGGWP